MKNLSGKFCGKCPRGAGGHQDEQGQHQDLAVKAAKRILSCVRWGFWWGNLMKPGEGGDLYPCSALPSHTWSAVPSSELLSARDTWTQWRESRKGPQRGIRVWRIPSRAGTGQGEGKLKGNLTNSQNMGKEGAKMEPSSVQAVPSDRIRCNGHKWNTRGSLWTSALSTSTIPWLIPVANS